MSSPLQTHQSLRHEQTQGGESTGPVSAEANHNTALERNDKQHYIGEATESVHDVSRSTSHDQVASSIGEDDTRDLEASIAEPPYTVFTSSQKRFIVLLTACAGFFSAVSRLASCFSQRCINIRRSRQISIFLL